MAEFIENINITVVALALQNLLQSSDMYECRNIEIDDTGYNKFASQTVRIEFICIMHIEYKIIYMKQINSKQKLMLTTEVKIIQNLITIEHLYQIRKHHLIIQLQIYNP